MPKFNNKTKSFEASKFDAAIDETREERLILFEDEEKKRKKASDLNAEQIKHAAALYDVIFGSINSNLSSSTVSPYDLFTFNGKSLDDWAREDNDTFMKYAFLEGAELEDFSKALVIQALTDGSILLEVSEVEKAPAGVDIKPAVQIVDPTDYKIATLSNPSLVSQKSFSVDMQKKGFEILPENEELMYKAQLLGEISKHKNANQTFNKDDFEAAKQFIKDNLRIKAAMEIADDHEKDPVTNLYVITPEQADANRLALVAADYKFLKAIKIAVAPLTEGNFKAAITEFNKYATEHNLPLIEEHRKKDDMASLSVKQYPPEALDKFVDCIFNQYELVAPSTEPLKAIPNMRTPREYTIEESTEPFKDAEIDALSESLGDKLTEEDKKMLNEIKKDTRLMTHETSNYLSSRKIQHPGAILEFNAGQTIKQYAGGKYSHLNFESKDKSHIKVDYVKTEEKQNLQDFINNPPKFNEENIKNIAEIVKMMKDAEIIVPFDFAEENQKVYGFRKIATSRDALCRILDNNELEPEEKLRQLREAKAQYDKDYKATKDILDKIKKTFGDSVTVQANMDSEREIFIPVEFVKDNALSAKFNGIYTMAKFCDKHNITIEQYLANPAKFWLEDQKNKVQTDGFQAKYNESLAEIENKTMVTTFQAVIDMYNADTADDIKQNLLYGGDPSITVTRTLDTAIFLENDPEKIKELKRYLLQTCTQMSIVADKEYAHASLPFVLLVDYNDQTKPKEYEMLRQGLKATLFTNNIYDKRFEPVTLLDDHGVKLENQFNYQEYVDVPNNAQNILNNYNACLQTDLRGTHLITKISASEAMFDYLIAHPEEEHLPEYQALEQAAIASVTDLELTEHSNDINKLKTSREKINTEVAKCVANVKVDDTATNKALKEIKKELGKVQPGSDKYNELRGDLDSLIAKRTEELKIGYQKGEISEHYLVERSKQLVAIKQNPAADIPALPEFFKKENEVVDIAAKNAFRKTVHDRQFSKGLPEFLQSKENFIKYKTDPDAKFEDQKDIAHDTLTHYYAEDRNLVDKDEFTADEWDLLYENAVRNYYETKPLPESFTTVQSQDNRSLKEQLEFDKKAYNEDYIDKIAVDAVKEGGVKLPQPEVLALFEQQKTGAMYNLQKMLTTCVPMLADDNMNVHQKEFARNTICKAIAQPIALGMIERKNYRVPANMTYIDLYTKIASADGFKKVVDPLIDEIVADYKEQGLQNNVLTEKGEKLVDMVKDRSILHAFGLQAQIEKKNLNAAHNAGPNINQNANQNPAQPNESSAVKHAKEQFHKPREIQPPAAPHL